MIRSNDWNRGWVYIVPAWLPEQQCTCGNYWIRHWNRSGQFRPEDFDPNRRFGLVCDNGITASIRKNESLVVSVCGIGVPVDCRGLYTWELWSLNGHFIGHAKTLAKAKSQAAACAKECLQGPFTPVSEIPGRFNLTEVHT